MADRLAKKYGTEDDKVNCPFYYKIGACRHGDSCTRLHNKPPLSQTLLFFHIYQNPRAAIAFAEGIQVPQEDLLEAAQHFEEFYEEVFIEFCKYGEVLDMIVADNIGEHMLGNLYLKYGTEEQAENCLRSMNGKLYNNNQIFVEFSPVTDFGEAKCRQYIEGQCERGGYCNFIHPKHIDKKLKRELKNQMYKEYPQYIEQNEEDKDGKNEKNDESNNDRSQRDDRGDKNDKYRSRPYRERSREKDPRYRRYSRERDKQRVDYRDKYENRDRRDFRDNRDNRDRYYNRDRRDHRDRGDYRDRGDQRDRGGDRRDYRDENRNRNRDYDQYPKRDEKQEELDRYGSRSYKDSQLDKKDSYKNGSQRENSQENRLKSKGLDNIKLDKRDKIEDQPNDNNKNKRNESEESFNKRAMRMNSEERRAMIQGWNSKDEQ